MMKRMSKRPFWITVTTLLVVSAYVMSLQGVTLAALYGSEQFGHDLKHIPLQVRAVPETLPAGRTAQPPRTSGKPGGWQPVERCVSPSRDRQGAGLDSVVAVPLPNGRGSDGLLQRTGIRFLGDTCR